MANSSLNDWEAYKHPYSKEDTEMIKKCKELKSQLEDLKEEKSWEYRNVKNVIDGIEGGRYFANQLDKPIMVKYWWENIRQAEARVVSLRANKALVDKKSNTSATQDKGNGDKSATCADEGDTVSRENVPTQSQSSSGIKIPDQAG